MLLLNPSIALYIPLVFFFFSSRRRHTRCSRDWSSDVCSSDLPHHENEIAQTETATGKRPFVGIWMHGGMMKLGRKKMSKSDGNMIFVRDALQRVSPEALRLYLLDIHYRRAYEHDQGRLARSAARSERLAAALGRGRGTLGTDRASRSVLALLEDDLDTPRAIRALESAVRADPDAKTRASLRAIARALGIVPG